MYDKNLFVGYLSFICHKLHFCSGNSRLFNSRDDVSKQAGINSTLNIENLAQNKYFRLSDDCRLEDSLFKSQQLLVTCDHDLIRMALDGKVLDRFTVTDGRLVRGQMILGQGYFFSVIKEQKNVKYLWLNDTDEIKEISKFADVPATENAKIVDDHLILNSENKIVVFDFSGKTPKVINEISIPQSFNIAINKKGFAVTTASPTFKEYSFYNLDGNRINLYRLDDSRFYDHLSVLDDRRYIINLCSEKTECRNNSQKLLVFDLTG